MNTFSATSCVKYGWETFKKRPGFFIGVTFVTFAVLLVVRAITVPHDNQFNAGYGLLSIVSILVSIVIDMGLIHFFLASNDNPSGVRFADVWHPKPFWKYLGMAIVVGIVVAIGFVLLIVPGIVLAIVFLFTKFLVIDRNLGPIEAMRESARLTKGRRWELFKLLVIVLAIDIVGAIPLGLGLLVTVPFTSIAIAHAYRQLSRTVPEAAPVAAAAPAAAAA